MTPEVLSEIESLRARIASGNYTVDDCRRAVEIMREGRAIAAEQSATSRTKKATAAAKKAPVNVDDLLSRLDSL